MTKASNRRRQLADTSRAGGGNPRAGKGDVSFTEPQPQPSRAECRSVGVELREDGLLTSASGLCVSARERGLG